VPKIVTSLLDFARQSKPIKSLHDINKIIQESMALTRKQAAFKDVAFAAALSDQLPRANLDKDQIQQCLINLALNSIEATDAGGEIRFTSRMIPEKEAIEVTISDTGRGIPENALDRVFEPFFTTKESGTGLGLAITHGIVQQHGGSIDVESMPGEGTTFRIYLPSSKERGMPDKEPRILVVDDELGICQSCVKILSKEGYEVEFALNGYNALKMMTDKPFDLIVNGS
jgi:two-component system, NtrC family, sensor kinase